MLRLHCLSPLRYEVPKAVEAGGDTITFDETIDLGGGAKCGDPIVAANTIRLEFGEIHVEDNNLKLNPLSKGLSILGPKHNDDSTHHVAIAWAGSPFKQGDDSYGTDWSVFEFINTRKPVLQKIPEVLDKYHPLWESVQLSGLQISSGIAEDGAGIAVTGFVHLHVVNTKIWNNNSTRLNPYAGTGTSRACLYAARATVDPLPLSACRESNLESGGRSRVVCPA